MAHTVLEWHGGTGAMWWVLWGSLHWCETQVLAERNVFNNLRVHLVHWIMSTFSLMMEEDVKKAVKELNKPWINSQPIHIQSSWVANFRKVYWLQFEMREYTREACTTSCPWSISRELWKLCGCQLRTKDLGPYPWNFITDPESRGLFATEVVENERMIDLDNSQTGCFYCLSLGQCCNWLTRQLKCD